MLPPVDVKLPYHKVTPHPLLRDAKRSQENQKIPMPEFNRSEIDVPPVPPIEFNFTLSKGFSIQGNNLQPVTIDYDFSNTAAEEEFHR